MTQQTIRYSSKICNSASELTSIDTASVCDNAKDDEADEQGDLQAGEPEFDLAVVLDSEEVGCDAQNQEYRNVNSKLAKSRKLAGEHSNRMQVVLE